MSARHMASAPSSRKTAPTPKKAKKGGLRTVLISLLVIALLAGVGFGGWFLFQRLSTFNIELNGQTHEVHGSDTVQTLIDEGVVKPTPGDLLAVDDSVLSKGEGERCAVTINGAKGYVTSSFSAGDKVKVSDGADTYEEETVTEEAIPYTTEEGDRSFASYYNAPIHILSKGKEGRRVWHTGKTSGITVSEDTVEPENAGYRVVSAEPESRVVALTFDDGPWEGSTEQILDILEENDAKATFFTIGNQIADNADVVKRAHKMGCDVFTHTWDHASGSGQGVSLALMSASEQKTEVERGYKAIADVIGEEPAHIMRAPGGNFYDDVITNLWDLVDVEVGWSIDTEDWSRPGVDSIVAAIMTAEPGSVILMHDGGGDRSQTVEALRQALPKLKEQGYSFVTVSELLDM